MSKNEKWFLHLTNFLAVASGLVYAWMIFWLRPLNEWDVFNHPLQKEAQAIHILTSPFLIFSVGVIWRNHIVGRLFKKNQKRKISGHGLLVAFFLMTITGYLLQISTEESSRSFFGSLHLWSSFLWILLIAIHIFRFKFKFKSF